MHFGSCQVIFNPQWHLQWHLQKQRFWDYWDNSGPIVEPKVKFFIGKNLQRNIYVSSFFRNNLWEMLQQMFSFDFCFGRTRFGRKSAMKSIFCRKNSIMTFIQLKIIRGKRKKGFLGSFFESRLTLWVQSEPKRILSS